LVERVLASPRYGERWAQHWLDVVRFAESDGFEMNHERPSAWHYRDYVIRAFNDDKPYDRFVFEQLAGDSVDENAATGFLVAGPWDRVKSPDKALTWMQRQDELADMTNTTGAAMLAMTMGCARCHNHKFDPILQKDYYSLQAVFAGVKHGERQLRIKSDLEHPQNGQELVYAGTFEQPKEPTHRLYRGDPAAPKEIVFPDVLSVLDSLGLAVDTPEQQRRVALAKWMTNPTNPLTPRVMVNRIWQYHFGTGIVDTPSDFGVNGSRPTHPQLLDWLARQFVERGWSIKHIHRLILLSNTYRQTSRPSERGLAVDAGTRLWWRFPPRRLEAEAIRDSVLQITGALNLEMGGPGWSAFKPNGNYVRVYEPKAEFGSSEWRRMIYMQRIRMRQDSVFGSFDAPDGGQACPKRARSTTAIQALNLFNSQFMWQQAELLAERLKREAGESAPGQVRQAFQLAFNRDPDESELGDSERLIAVHGLTAFCRAVLNANELMFIP
jgi:hypothetical protein